MASCIMNRDDRIMMLESGRLEYMLTLKPDETAAGEESEEALIQREVLIPNREERCLSACVQLGAAC
jgi:hypothetical protein